MFTNAAGNPVNTQQMTFTLDVPAEETHDGPKAIGTRNWGAIIAATIALGIAMTTGNQVQIQAAIQALIIAITGQ